MSAKPTLLTRKAYPLLSLFQYFFAIGVIAVHSGSLSKQPVLHFIIKSIWGRQAVPFFLISSAYFLHKKALTHPDAVTKHLKHLLRLYLLWSILYLPYAYHYFCGLGLPQFLLPFGLVVGLLYTGLCYQLWYLPAFFQGFFLVKAGLKRWKPQTLLIVLISLYLLGSVETYMGYLEGTGLGRLYQSYAKFFLTSRNGLFFTPLFLLLGQILADQDKTPLFTHNRGRKVIISLGLFLLEASVIYHNQGWDKNFFLTLPLLSLSLVNWCLHTQCTLELPVRHLRQLAIGCYFIHPVFIELGLWLLRKEHLASWQSGQLVFTGAVIASHLTILLWMTNRSGNSWLPTHIIPKSKKTTKPVKTTKTTKENLSKHNAQRSNR